MRRHLARWRSHAHQVGEQWATWRRQWKVQRDLEVAVCRGDAIVAGPWCSEVGFEVLYWIPFLRWVMAAYRIPPERIIAVSRGGARSWYDGVAAQYVDVLDYVPPGELAARAAAGVLKQREFSDFDRSILDRVSRAPGWPSQYQVLHPSLMFRWFAPFWSGHETLAFVERHTRYALATAPEVVLPVELPHTYVALKLYAARSLPDRPDIRAQLRSLVDSLRERWPVVSLDTGIGIDDHADYALGGERVLTLAGRLDPATNLAVQTKVVAGARLFVGTCGSLAWLAPLLGVPTLPLFADASFLHAHLHVARRVYGRVGAASFSPVDLTGVLDAGLALGGAALPVARANTA